MNPFRDAIVADPWRNQQGDVPAIHHAVFEQCLEGLAHVRRQQHSAGLLIHGEAGSGKTHLLSRLRAQLTPQAPTATDREENLFVWVRLQTSPRMIWRTMRRTLVNDWFRPVAGMRSQFDRILFHRLAEIRVAEGDLDPWFEYMLQEDPQGLTELLDRIAQSLDLDRNTAVAFEHIAFDRHRRDLRAWLSGDSLPEAALARLDLAQDEGTDEEREDEARRVVLMLCRLAGNGLPIVIGLDQVEALQMTPQDTEGLFAFGQLTSILHDNTENVLLVSCVQSSFATQLKDRARSADYDRMTSLGAMSLDPLSPAQAEELIAARIDSVGDELSVATRLNPVWPLERAEFQSLFTQDRPLTPRRLLGLCAARFETRLRSEAVEGSEVQASVKPAASSSELVGKAVEAAAQADQVEDFLVEAWKNSLEQKAAANLPERTEEILRHGFPMLCRLLSPSHQSVTNEQLPDVSLVFQKGASRTGLAMCMQPNMNSLAAQLKRLKGQFPSPQLKRLVILRDPRVPLSATAKKAREHLTELEQQGAKVVYPLPEVLAAIDALRELLSDAKSGDLACAGETVPPSRLEEWLRANLSNDMRTFVKTVLGE
ncbi:P-loop NTPase family protein [Planctomicrobium piriforme]|uniref:AAA domain-containing protein n=1 Tax=Planctomicrobium piriforme TaxID=1576369 RepID=A0A1I3IFR2_9PLAN|nr:AAA family ATPase [Planctomicrobium piriforme]SFI46766.1 AAA domain-containing protein [Planctomicrobium piriforme]